jgi:hypothetical protein
MYVGLKNGEERGTSLESKFATRGQGVIRETTVHIEIRTETTTSD